ncbi:hypothetical protein CDAR_420911 [Caerostris darwini]|uniref:Uncharacterized protein n=1 Tax=Caerostris darwini TaxID=1538125 RepID=A0AAV4X0J7_9ARAC|nr:hypothetical protein CDAR_420911 [Caerostris darwini]
MLQHFGIKRGDDRKLDHGIDPTGLSFLLLRAKFGQCPAEISSTRLEFGCYLLFISISTYPSQGEAFPLTTVKSSLSCLVLFCSGGDMPDLPELAKVAEASV